MNGTGGERKVIQVQPMVVKKGEIIKMAGKTCNPKPGRGQYTRNPNLGKIPKSA